MQVDDVASDQIANSAADQHIAWEMFTPGYARECGRGGKAVYRSLDFPIGVPAGHYMGEREGRGGVSGGKRIATWVGFVVRPEFTRRARQAGRLGTNAIRGVLEHRGKERGIGHRFPR